MAMRTYFDPHPGLMGCTARLPEPVRLAAEGLAGLTMSDEAVLTGMRAVAPEGATFQIVPYGADHEQIGGPIDRKEHGDGMLLMRVNTEAAPGLVSNYPPDSVFAPHHSWRVLKWRWAKH